ncbi:MAG: hypothetical protein ACREOW_12920 [Thermodesulfobacteriota bacterium]
MKEKRKIKLYVGLVLIFILGFSNCLYSQETKNGEGNEKPNKILERLEKLLEGDKGQKPVVEMTEQFSSYATENPDPMLPLAPHPELFDQQTKEKYLAALREYFDYRISGLQHRQRVFEWQLFSSKVIFVVVLLLVSTGIYFAAVQFHSGLGRRAKATGASEGDEVTEFAASLKGVKVKSPVLGVIILVISLAFFYLYLAYVYPIENIF